jgi:hypothetical protein
MMAGPGPEDSQRHRPGAGRWLLTGELVVLGAAAVLHVTRRLIWLRVVVLSRGMPDRPPPAIAGRSEPTSPARG